MLTEAKAFGFILAVVLFLASLVLSFHEGEAYQGNKDKVVAQALQIASQKALDEANKLADDKEKSMQASMDQLAQQAQELASENDKERQQIADYMRGTKQLRVKLASAISCGKVPDPTTSASIGDGSSSAVVDDQVAGRLAELVAEHNQVVRQLQEAQNAIRVLEGVPTDVMPPVGEIPS